MSAIDPDIATKLFGAIENIRDHMPEIEAVSALVPGYGPAIVEGEKFLAKLFELVSVLRSSETHADAAAALRKKTEDDWAQALRRE